MDELGRSTILDPMAGQGFFLSRAAPKDSRVWLGDINPGPLLLASLRDPALIRKSTALYTWYSDRLKLCRLSNRSFQAEYCDEWVPQALKNDLLEYSTVFRLNRLGNPLELNAKLWQAPARTRFAAALVALAARDLACYTGSDNVTWLKRGGLQRHGSIREPLRNAMNRWLEYAESRAGRSRPTYELHLSVMDSAVGCFGTCPKVDLIVTSPPYANRLDYSRMWAPELQVLAAMLDFDPTAVKARQIGTTVVHARKPTDAAIAALPSFMRTTLKQIRDDDGAKASASYYYPFFCNYAISLSSSFVHLVGKMRSGCTAVVFVRDTVRKDTLFQAGRLVDEIFRSRGCIRLAKHEVVIRHHVGMMRRSSPASMFGLAQREWWLVFRKR